MYVGRIVYTFYSLIFGEIYFPRPVTLRQAYRTLTMLLDI